MNAGSGRRRPGALGAAPLTLAAAALAVSALLWAVSAPGASAAELCVEEGSGAGQCDGTEGVAANFSKDRVYVAETDNHRVSVFKADGEFLFAFGWGVDDGSPEPQTCTAAGGCQAGIPGSGAGQFNTPRQIAVDNVSGSEDVYVGTDNFRVQRFEADGTYLNAIGQGAANSKEECEIARTIDVFAVGPGGNLFVADAYKRGAREYEGFNSRVEKFSPAGACLGEVDLFGPTATFPTQRASHIVVDGEEDAYVIVDAGGGELRKYDLGADEAELCKDTTESGRLAIDAGGRLFAFQREGHAIGFGVHLAIAELDTACEGEALAVLDRFGYDQLSSNANSLAALHSGEGDLFASEGGFFGYPGLIRHLTIPPPGPAVVRSTLEVGSIGASKATISAEVNPGSKDTEVRIQYVEEAGYDKDKEEGGDGFEGEGVKESPPATIEPAPLEGASVHGVQALVGCLDPKEGECLLPDTPYRYRVIATNADDSSLAEGEPFESRPHLKALWAAGVGTDSATLRAEADPYGIPTTARFEYVEEATCEADEAAEGPGHCFDRATLVPDPEAEAPLDFGKGEGALTRQVSLGALREGTSYRYRAVFVDELRALASEALSFETYAAEVPTGPCANEAVRKGAAAYLPDCRGYELVSPLEKAGGDIVVQGESFTNLPATLNQAATSGEKLAYGTYRAYGDAASAPLTSQYITRRTPAGWSGHAINPPYEGPIGNAAVFDNEYRAFSENLCEAWLTPFAEPPLAPGAVPGYFNVYRRTDELCGGPAFGAITTAPPENVAGADYVLELQGRSAGGEVTVFAARDSLEGTAAPDNETGKTQLYAKRGFGPGGETRFVCLLPGGVPSESSCSAGTNHASLAFGTHRLAGLDRAVSEDGTRVFWTDAAEEGEIYVRIDPFGEGAECAGEGAPCTVAVSAAGEALSGTAKSNFWAAAADGSRAIYSSGRLDAFKAELYSFEVDAEATTPIAGEVSGVVGTSADATVVYFTSAEAIAGAGANSEGDEAVAGEPNLYRFDLKGGEYQFVGTLAAGDADPLPNIGSSAVALEPIYHDGRVSADGAHAAFMSTAPLTGYDNTDAASGEADTEVFVHDAGEGALRCVSCDPSGGRPDGAVVKEGGAEFWVAARLPVFQNSLYASRVLSGDGSRVYFEAGAPLSPRDANGHIDLYQWEERGRGNCTEDSTTFSPAAGGCIGLISSGKATTDVTFLDASPSGDDVFFTTDASLYGADYGLVDIYDARVGGGFAPPEPPAPECEGESCQSPPPAPELDTPASLGFAGPGDLAAPAPRCAAGARKAKRLARRAKRLRRSVRRAKTPARRGAMSRKARRSARAARRLSRNAKRCRARARAARRSQR